MVRFKKRYFLVEIDFRDGKVDDSLAKESIYEAVKGAVKTAHGDYGLACIQMSLRVKYMNPVTNVVFIACGRDHHKMLQSSLTFIKSIKGRECMFRTLYIGGTIRSCQKFLVKYNKAQLFGLLDKCKNKAEHKKVLSLIDSAMKEETVLDSIWVWKRRTRVLTQKAKKSKDQYTDSD